MILRAVQRFSLVALLLALVVVGGGAGAGLVADTRVGAFLGMLVGGFLLGVAVERRPLLEATVAAMTTKLVVLTAVGIPGVGLTGAAAALGSIGSASLAVSLALAGATGGFGAHLGADLRDGLTAPLDGREPAMATTEARDGSTVRSRTEAMLNDEEPGNDDPTRNESPVDPEGDRELIRQSADE